MNNHNYDVVIIGGGPAGLAAAYSAKLNGAKKILVIERDRELGGILQQCIHNGFGLHRFKQELTGPGYAQRYIKMVEEHPEIEIMLDTMVLEVSEDKLVLAVNPEVGILKIQAKAVIFTMGCRERTRGAIRTPGWRPAGVFTAGAAQRMVNMEGYIPGKKVVILGSGDIGLIMARRLTLEGAQVQAVLEIMPYSNGLTRNIVQCLEDFNIPLHLAHTIVAIQGNERITGVTCAKVDENMRPIPGTEFELECDCLLLSVGLIPENEISEEVGVKIDPKTSGPIVDQRRQTSIPGFFAAGNVVHVHDLVDFVSEEGEIAGKYAALYAQGILPESYRTINVLGENAIRTVVPQKIVLDDTSIDAVRLFMRVGKPEEKLIVEVTGAKEQVIATKRLPIAKPGEMIELDIPVDKFRDAGEFVVVTSRKAVKA
ncbi:NAD(P)/FAD-dependent oxidoreductase [Dendrosporobacter sp. 1207_IL3150]|uniref:NAD(P)/FAD-dependent oxidoreductase n=1 Tax=Dendrosporobacter sp. 1207_IL3150 TaxID=3084054 RepID=UPI002FDB29D7